MDTDVRESVLLEVANPQHVGTQRDADYQLAALVDAETWHFWFRQRRGLVLWALQRYFPSCRNFLEIGCGTGFLLEGLRHRSASLALTACDTLRDSIVIAR